MIVRQQASSIGLESAAGLWCLIQQSRTPMASFWSLLGSKELRLGEKRIIAVWGVHSRSTMLSSVICIQYEAECGINLAEFETLTAATF
jgi:hypothetical protein